MQSWLDFWKPPGIQFGSDRRPHSSPEGKRRINNESTNKFHFGDQTIGYSPIRKNGRGNWDYIVSNTEIGSSIGLAGEYNNDGLVDAANYTTYQDNFGGDSSVLNGNGSGAGTVVQADYYSVESELR